MSSDEVFIAQLRTGLRSAVADADPPATLLSAVANELNRPSGPRGSSGASLRRGVLRLRPLLAGALAVGVTAVVVVVALLAHGPTHHRSLGAVPSAHRGVVGIVGVLRRPQTAFDRRAAERLRAQLGRLSSPAVPVAGGARLVAVPAIDARIMLVPVLPARAHAQPGTGTVARSTKNDRLAFLGLGRPQVDNAAQILAGQEWKTGHVGVTGHRSSFYFAAMVVPDGVAKVTFSLPRPVTATVDHNIAAFKSKTPIQNLNSYPMTWLGPTGAIIKQFAPPQPPRAPAGARSLTTILRVLRRTQTAADRNPAFIRLLQHEGHNRYTLALEGRPVVSLLRLATVAPWGAPIYVVPFLAPNEQAKQRLPHKERGVTVAATAALVTYPINGGNGVPAMIEGGRDIANGDYRDGTQPGPHWVMVVPDGVAKVTLWQATRSDVKHPRHPIKPGSKPIIVSVHNNIAAFTAPDFHRPGQEIWYAPDGKVVKRIANASSCGPPLGDCA